MIVVDVPGAFDCFLSGTGAIQGDPYSSHPDQERGARELADAYRRRAILLRGKGYSMRLVLDSIDAAVVLAEYAETCLTTNFGGDLEHSEVRAARRVLERVEEATEGRVVYNGFRVLLDGEVVPL